MLPEVFSMSGKDIELNLVVIIEKQKSLLDEKILLQIWENANRKLNQVRESSSCDQSDKYFKFNPFIQNINSARNRNITSTEKIRYLLLAMHEILTTSSTFANCLHCALEEKNYTADDISDAFTKMLPPVSMGKKIIMGFLMTGTFTGSALLGAAVGALIGGPIGAIIGAGIGAGVGCGADIGLGMKFKAKMLADQIKQIQSIATGSLTFNQPQTSTLVTQHLGGPVKSSNSPIEVITESPVASINDSDSKTSLLKNSRTINYASCDQGYHKTLS